MTKRAWKCGVVGLVLAGLLVVAGGEPADKEPASKPSTAVLAAKAVGILESRCADCHGVALDKPKAKIGCIPDVPRMIKGKLIVPGDPDKSRVYRIIQRGECPPRKAKSGKVTAEEKVIIRDWIAAGAADPKAPASASAPATRP